MDETLRRLRLGLIVGVVALSVGLFIGMRWGAMEAMSGPLRNLCVLIIGVCWGAMGIVCLYRHVTSGGKR